MDKEKFTWEHFRMEVQYKWESLIYAPAHFWHRFSERVVGMWDYFWFIWKTECYHEWDYDYLYQLMDFKLRRMAVQLRKDNFVVGSDDRYNEILEALTLLTKYRDIEDYVSPATKGGDYSRISAIEMLDEKQQAWNDFHNILRDKAQGWWS